MTSHFPGNRNLLEWKKSDVRLIKQHQNVRTQITGIATAANKTNAAQLQTGRTQISS